MFNMGYFHLNMPSGIADRGPISPLTNSLQAKRGTSDYLEFSRLRNMHYES